MTGINVPLLRKALEDITAHPEEWSQAVWGKKAFEFEGKVYRGKDATNLWWEQAVHSGAAALEVCGTTCCLAGNVMTRQLPGEFVFAGGFVAVAVKYEGEERDIGEAAEKELGLTGAQAYMLFHGSNSLSDLWRLANQFTEGEIEIPHEYLEG